jgi:hypothetical protein
MKDVTILTLLILPQKWEREKKRHEKKILDNFREDVFEGPPFLIINGKLQPLQGFKF